LVELSTRYLRGIAHLGERVVLVLDVSELLRVTEVAPALSSENFPVLS